MVELNDGSLLMTVREYAAFRHNTDKPTTAQMNSVRNMISRKSIPAAKHGGMWVIRLEVPR